MSAPKVVLGTNRPLSLDKDEREYSSTVESFFLHSSERAPFKAPSNITIDDKIAITTTHGHCGDVDISPPVSTSVAPTSTGNGNIEYNNKYALHDDRGYDISYTLSVCRTLTMQTNMDAPRQGGDDRSEFS